ncbi:MAG TPA: hypothetical protein VM687_14970 [Stenotrophomonas sp.]|nr:hypothetical protein [Stenotrophomonas sp.]
MSAVIIHFRPRAVNRLDARIGEPGPKGQQLAALIASRFPDEGHEGRIEQLTSLIADRARCKPAEHRPEAGHAPREYFSSLMGGSDGAIATAFQIAAWAQSARALPSIAAFMDRWGMSRATAYRYRRKLIDSGLLSTSKGRQ